MLHFRGAKFEELLGVVGKLAELAFPQECAGCGLPGSVLCGVCRTLLREKPHVVARPRNIGIPVYALGDYTHMRRRLIIAMKEYNNAEVRPYVGAVVAAGITHLRAEGQLPHELTLVPAPTRVSSARKRGGDPVTAICQSAAAELSSSLSVAVPLKIKPGTVDQSLLGADDRWLNVHGSLELRAQGRDDGTSGNLRGKNIVLVDDVVTTGATLAASAAILRSHGAIVRCGLVLADAR